jgi:hypothetical protein
MGHTDGSSEHRFRNPSASRARTPFPGRYRPAPRVGHDVAGSMISGTTPCSRSARPRARPAIPPPTIRIREGTAFELANLLLSPRVVGFRGSRQNSAPRVHICRWACASVASASARSRRRRPSSRSMADARLPFAMNCGRTRGDPRKAAPSAHQSTCRTGNVSVGESRCSIVAARRARRAGTFAVRAKTTC